MLGELAIIATPIGNLSDISFRALETLKSVDAVICEDTRHTSILLNHYQIKKPLISLHKFNEAKQTPKIIKKLELGEKLALVSDAGTPLIADPGLRLIKACIAAKIKLTAIPGPSALTCALTISGLPTEPVIFLGYLPKKEGKRVKLLEELRACLRLKATIVIYEAPHRLLKTLTNINQVFGEIEIVLARELTKIHEEIRREKISQAITHFKQNQPKGEFTLLFNPNLA